MATSTRDPIETDVAWLTEAVSRSLKLPPSELKPEVPLTRYGLDSLAAVEIATAIAGRLGREVPETLLFDHPDIRSLARYIHTHGERAGGIAAEADAARSAWDQMLADGVLPSDIEPAAGPPATRVRSILLTGATGFLGTRLLHALLRDTDADIYCLVRAASSAEGARRIEQALADQGHWQPALAPRIHAVVGDIRWPHLGVTDETFDTLCRTIDVVYHCAAAVNWTFSYLGLRQVNVLATRELLRLACRFRAKPFHFVSSVGVCYSTAGPAIVSERDDVWRYLRGIHLGYAQSKSVGEALVRQAAARGLPVKIYRPALVAGDSRSGISNHDDFLSLLIKGCIEMRAAPDLNWMVDCCPVDYVADAVARLSRDTQDPLDVLHLVNPGARHWRECVLWMNLFGYPVRLEPYETWLTRLAAEAGTPAHPLYALRPFFEAQPAGVQGLRLPQLYEEHRRSRLSDTETASRLLVARLRCPPLNARLLDRYFQTYIQRRFLPCVEQRPGRSNAGSEITLDADFFTPMLRDRYRNPALRVRGVSVDDHVSGHSIIAELTSWRYGRTAGLFGARLDLEPADSSAPGELEVIVKVKPDDREVLEVAERVAALCAAPLGHAFRRHKRRTALAGCHVREIAIYQQSDERFRRHTPIVYGTVRDDERSIWLVVLEKLRAMELMNTADDVSGWRRAHIEAAVRGLAELQAIWYRREAELLRQPWLRPVFSVRAMVELTDLWAALADHAGRYFSRWCGPAVIALQRELIARIDDWWRDLDTLPRTLIHNDFNPRNVAFRRARAGHRLCVYDWELATLGVPQHDLAELLCFVLPASASGQEIAYYLEAHRRALERASDDAIDAGSWRLGFHRSLCNLLVNRLPMYTMVHAFRPQRFLPRVLRTWRTLYAHFSGEFGPGLPS